MSNDRATNVADFIGECNGGSFIEKLAMALSDAANAQINHGAGGKKSKITLEFSFQQMGQNEQVIISHKLATSLPTKRGKKSEEDITDTAFFVGKGGCMTINQPEENDHGQYSLSHGKPDPETGEVAATNVRRITN